MMKIFDYIFYRSYLHFKKKDDSPMFSSVAIISCIVMPLLFPFWSGFMKLIAHTHIHKSSNYFSQRYPVDSVCTVVVLYLLVYLAYHKRKIIIIEKFKNSRYNKMLSDKAFFTTLVLGWWILSFIGIQLSFIVDHYIYENNLYGILDKYIQLL